MINEIVASLMHLFFLLDYNNMVLQLLNHNLGERVLRVFCCVGSIEVHVPLSNFTTKKVKASVNDKKIERRVVIIDKMIKITMLVWCVLFILTTRIQCKVFCKLFEVFDFVKCISLVNHLKSGVHVRKCKHNQRTSTD